MPLKHIQLIYNQHLYRFYHLNPDADNFIPLQKNTQYISEYSDIRPLSLEPRNKIGVCSEEI